MKIIGRIHRESYKLQLIKSITRAAKMADVTRVGMSKALRLYGKMDCDDGYVYVLPEYTRSRTT